VAGARDANVRVEFPADPRFVSAVRVAVGSSAGVYADPADSRELSAAVGEALVIVGVDAGREGTCAVDALFEPGCATVTVTGPGLDADADEGEMARLMLTGLSDDFSEPAGTGEATVTLSKAFSAIQ
jgi:hypothetical protein